MANQITLLRILLIFPFVICMLKNNIPETGDYYRYMAFGLFLLIALSDILDGYVARKFNQISKLGSFLDPMADKLMMLFSCVLLAGSTSAVKGFRLPFAVLAVVVGKDLVLTAGFIAFYYLTKKVKVVPNILGKFCTGIQLGMIGSVLVGPEFSGFVNFWAFIVKMLWVLSALTAFFATLIYIRNGSRYIEEFQQAGA